MNKLLIGLFSFGIILGIIAEIVVWYPPFNTSVLLACAGIGTLITIIALIYWSLTLGKNGQKTQAANIVEYVFVLSTLVLVVTGIVAVLLYAFHMNGLYGTLAYLGLSIAPILLAINSIIMIYLATRALVRQN